jgi:hypothetical protein
MYAPHTPASAAVSSSLHASLHMRLYSSGVQEPAAAVLHLDFSAAVMAVLSAWYQYFIT